MRACASKTMNREPEKSAGLAIGGFLWRLASRRLTVSIAIAVAGAVGWNWLTDSSPQTARATTPASAKHAFAVKLDALSTAKWIETNPVTPLRKKAPATKFPPAKALAEKTAAAKPAAKV